MECIELGEVISTRELPTFGTEVCRCFPVIQTAILVARRIFVFIAPAFTSLVIQVLGHPGLFTNLYGLVFFAVDLHGIIIERDVGDIGGIQIALYGQGSRLRKDAADRHAVILVILTLVHNIHVVMEGVALRSTSIDFVCCPEVGILATGKEPAFAIQATARESFKAETVHAIRSFFGFIPARNRLEARSCSFVTIEIIDTRHKIVPLGFGRDRPAIRTHALDFPFTHGTTHLRCKGICDIHRASPRIEQTELFAIL